MGILRFVVRFIFWLLALLGIAVVALVVTGFIFFDQLGRRDPLMAEVTMHVRGGCVSRFTGVNDDDRPSLAAELQRRAEPGC